MTLIGFPHSEISGSTPACGSPKLIAASHVLHRLLTPRHPPCALTSLTANLLHWSRDRSASVEAFHPKGPTRIVEGASFRDTSSTVSSRVRSSKKETPLVHFKSSTHNFLLSHAFASFVVYLVFREPSADHLGLTTKHSTSECRTCCGA